MNLGTYGIFTVGRALSEDERAEAARLVEELGFRTLWIGGSPLLPSLRTMLAATDELIIATGIVNIWAYEPDKLAAEYTDLEGEFPGRLLLGIGIGHPEVTAEYTKPLTKTSEFLDGLDAASTPVSKDRRCLAALGPKMLALSAERSLGTHPYYSPVGHTRAAREQLGAGPLIAPELACVVGEDPGKAKARAYSERYLLLKNYTSNLKRSDFTDDDIASGGSDRLIDAIVPQGSPESIAAAARAHVEAGADHVCVQTIGVSGVPREEWTALARVLLG
ncbi:MAG: TIGR03620 family F420-dependent LLM class oxidoreductase [Solirubrobacteraceae bacterium]